MKLRIAIFSDFHCHNKNNNNNTQESYLLTDVTIDTFQDPFKSFEILIKNDSTISADLLVLPGDFTNKCDLEGLQMGWDIAKQIGKLLNVEKIIPNIGNHDVDSRKIRNSDPFNDIKNFSLDFPFNDVELNSFFWENGYIIIEDENYRILNINTVHSHTTKEMANKGLIHQDAINNIEERLNKSLSNKVNIAVCHHNPIEHSHYNTGSTDFLNNGDELIKILDRMNFDLIIHGHKHDPRIRYSPGGINSPIVFSSGSFSAFKNLLLQGANNTFHIITFECNEDQIGKGIIDTWFFVPTKGWKQNIKNIYFEPRIGFGVKVDIRALSSKIHQWFDQQKDNIVSLDDLIETFQDIKFMIPSDVDKLKNELKNKNIFVSPVTLDEPTFVQYKKVSNGK
ncbi:metallophosphoesterase family protein [Flectobacillus roseus]|uniref:Metallophosphoesterase n=1 Tax=Flectobacillus roseus TaxID=502259 RepID=A0ABT6Y3W2_9BACT|nr:metallophosphoesterase [Flectobacillus roseus]MDI9857966.1 metallophosphoesterase [Flectobacillus roseus]